jgi:hypothetical protein
METLLIDPTASPNTRGIQGQLSSTTSNQIRSTMPRREAWTDNEVKFVNPKSQSGTLHVYIEGFLKRKQETRLKSSDVYSLDWTVFPDETKNTMGEGSKLTSLPSSIDFDGYCNYSKQVSFPITWSLQQVREHFGFFKFSLNTDFFFIRGKSPF